jgi:hypothetical protein
MTGARICPRCKREFLDPVALAAAADKVRAVVAGAVQLAQGGSELEAAYGGPIGLRRALEGQLLKAEGLALELSRATACLAGTCIIPVANEPQTGVGPRQ